MNRISIATFETANFSSVVLHRCARSGWQRSGFWAKGTNRCGGEKVRESAGVSWNTPYKSCLSLPELEYGPIRDRGRMTGVSGSDPHLDRMGPDKRCQLGQCNAI